MTINLYRSVLYERIGGTTPQDETRGEKDGQNNIGYKNYLHKRRELHK